MVVPSGCSSSTEQALKFPCFYFVATDIKNSVSNPPTLLTPAFIILFLEICPTLERRNT